VPDESKSATAWRTLFEAHNVVEEVRVHGFADLTADQLRMVREPRLLTKIDHAVHLPAVFAENELGILTLSGSSWRIGKFNTFQKLTEWTPPAPHVKRVSIPGWLESLSQDLITGEGAAMNAADACGVLESFCGQKLVSTITGKGGSGNFDFVIGPTAARYNISVRGAQIEVDGGYEGEDSLCLFEAKRHISTDFNVRQLYYPMRAWRSRVRKPVRTIFFTFANNVFDLHEFGFADPSDFSSVQLIKHDRYLLASATVDLGTLLKHARSHEGQLGAVLHAHAVAADIPAPQADDFERVIDLTEFLSEEPSTKEEIAARYPIVNRQVDYYLNAARYLRFVEECGTNSDGATLYCASASTIEILRQPHHIRLLRLAEVVLQYGPISMLYSNWRVSGSFPSKDEAVESFRKSPVSAKLSEVTLRRRSATIRSWLKWVCELGPNSVVAPDLVVEP
jgi:hypothetical protein